MTTSAKARADVHQHVTDTIIRMLESADQSGGAFPWCRPGVSHSRPTNALSQKRYRGINVLTLWGTADAANYRSGLWATLKQWNELGARVKKGEKASPIVFYKPLEIETENERHDAGKPETKTIRMGTGIIILPQRNPLVLAKEMASLDVVSNGRLIFGIGIGYLKPEFDALGIPFGKKGPRTLEYLEAMQAIWSQDHPTYNGEFTSFSRVQALPRPIQKPHPPFVFGGMTRQAFQRSVTHGNGWYGFALDIERTKKCLAELQEAHKNNERPSVLGKLEISVTPIGQVDLDMVKRFADIGVDRLIVLPPTQSDTELFSLTVTEEEVTGYVRHIGDTVVGQV